MKTELWYSVQNGGDGSAYPQLMESEAQCELDQRFMQDGWGESCVGCFVVESDGPVVVKSVVIIAAQRKQIAEQLNEDHMRKYKREGKYPEWVERLEGHLAALIALKAKGE